MSRASSPSPAGGGWGGAGHRRPLPRPLPQGEAASPAMSDVQTIGAVAEDRIAVASNWKLVWWRFRRHHLALVSAGLLICMYLVVLCPDFFSTQNPRTDRRAPGVHPGAGAALLRRRLEPLGSGDRRQAQSGDAAHGMDHRSAAQGARELLHPRRALPRARPVRDQHPSARRRRSRASASSCSAPIGSVAISGRASCAARKPR